MNTKQAKDIQLSSLLEKLGYDPVKNERGGRELKYLSPLRSEELPSFNLSLDKNCFYDFGEGEGGNTLDFAILYLQARGKPSSVSDALKFLDEVMGGIAPVQRKDLPDLFKSKNDEEEGADRSLEFVNAMPLKSKRVLDYLQNQRRITPDIAFNYLSLVQYKNLNKPRKDGKPFYGFGMQNLSDGWEVRSASDEKVFKSAIIKRDISVIPGTESRGVILVFEGMLDFCSLLILNNTRAFKADSLIMHSLSSYNKAKEYILENGYQRTVLFLDNNTQGQKYAEKFAQELGECVQDYSSLYLPHEDVNDALRAGNRVFEEVPEFSL